MPTKFKNNELFERITNEDNIYKSYKKALQGKGKYNPEAMEFALTAAIKSDDERKVEVEILRENKDKEEDDNEE